MEFLGLTKFLGLLGTSITLFLENLDEKEFSSIIFISSSILIFLKDFLF
jgi:hypothetical protein